ncbi:GNAT family N-acetyltransferase [Bordetella hinzii]|uniref:GNAT family N-acetyltransferase n=1 Tax=Bordetella hinzii TaxID=103855 RepID=UPI00114E0482|nr:GNAT family N-acetyltransferase [Bordetella hinzii]QDJ48479.1 GNAT family N-acetyltransferase [Bordetella hinzii]WPL80064.1 GNAT family N-acetyltransferase [Bordetella hinzii]
MKISPENARTPDVSALIEALDAYQIPLSPPESHHGVDLDTLCGPDVVFLVARDQAGQALGCGGVLLAQGYAELKRMYVRPAARGQGVAQALLARLQAAAADAGIHRIHLETGARQAEALAFYRRQGYAECPPFGDYRPDPHSVFMVKLL